MNARVARATARHALGWLVAANAVGVLLAALLVWPELNGLLAPLTYGRWVPLHLDWQLYGWCALPLVGALGAWCVAQKDERGARWFAGALTAWSAALALGGLSWLGGVTSGKVFLEWSGWARPLLPAAMVVLWGALAGAAWRRRGEFDGAGKIARGAVLAGLAAVPAVLAWAMGREVYPSVNPDSGGATGAALLGSTLGLVGIAGWLPRALGLARRERGNEEDQGRAGPDRSGPATRDGRHGGRAFTAGGIVRGREVVFWGALVVSGVVFAAVDHGDTSHHGWAQIAALGTLFAWVPLAVFYFRGFEWPGAARRWLVAGAAWWALLVASGWAMFLPGESERWKFTHGLVAHAHLAMAGVATSVGAAVLAGLGRAPGGGAAWFWAWQLGLAGQLAALAALGVGEGANATGFFGGAGWVTFLMVTRLAAGVAMLVASVVWLKEETT